MKTDMAHLDVSFDDVVLAADTLQNDHKQVTIDAVRDTIGAGSTKRIHQHLAQWRATHARPVKTPKADMPPALLEELSRWAQQYAQDAGVGMRDALARADSDLQALLATGDELEAERDGLSAALTHARVAQEQAQLIAEERNEEIDRLTAELRNARQIAADALVGKAKDQLAIDGKDAQLAELRQQLERNVAATAAESDARLRAQMELIGVTTERDNMAGEVKELRARLDTSRTERSALRAELDSFRARA